MLMHRSRAVHIGGGGSTYDTVYGLVSPAPLKTGQ